MSASMPKVGSKVPEKSINAKASKTAVKPKDNKPDGDAPKIEKALGKRVKNVPVKSAAKSPPKEAKKSSGEPKTVYPNTGVPFMQWKFTEALERNERTSLAAIQSNAEISAKICMQTRAYFICENDRCQVQCWTSNRAWITMDLARPGVLRRYKQRCGRCAQASWPRIFNDALEHFLDHVIEIYLSRAEFVRHPSSSTKNNAPARNGGNNKNHRQDLCEKCGYGKRNCAVGTSYRF